MSVAQTSGPDMSEADEQRVLYRGQVADNKACTRQAETVCKTVAKNGNFMALNMRGSVTKPKRNSVYKVNLICYLVAERQFEYAQLTGDWSEEEFPLPPGMQNTPEFLAKLGQTKYDWKALAQHIAKHIHGYAAQLGVKLPPPKDVPRRTSARIEGQSNPGMVPPYPSVQLVHGALVPATSPAVPNAQVQQHQSPTFHLENTSHTPTGLTAPVAPDQQVHDAPTKVEGNESIASVTSSTAGNNLENASVPEVEPPELREDSNTPEKMPARLDEMQAKLDAMQAKLDKSNFEITAARIEIAGLKTENFRRNGKFDERFSKVEAVLQTAGLGTFTEPPSALPAPGAVREKPQPIVPSLANTPAPAGLRKPAPAQSPTGAAANLSEVRKTLLGPDAKPSNAITDFGRPLHARSGGTKGSRQGQVGSFPPVFSPNSPIQAAQSSPEFLPGFPAGGKRKAADPRQARQKNSKRRKSFAPPGEDEMVFKEKALADLENNREKQAIHYKKLQTHNERMTAAIKAGRDQAYIDWLKEDKAEIEKNGRKLGRKDYKLQKAAGVYERDTGASSTPEDEVNALMQAPDTSVSEESS